MLHHIVEWLLHIHELVPAHHAWRELLGLGVLVALGCSVGSEHHLHVQVAGVHVHVVSWESSHLTWHHHVHWEISNVTTHVHVTHWVDGHSLWLRHIIHFVGTSATTTT